MKRHTNEDIKNETHSGLFHKKVEEIFYDFFFLMISNSVRAMLFTPQKINMKY